MYPTISMRELELWIDQGKAMVLIDLRNRPSFEHCHIKGAVSIPFPELEQHVAELSREKVLVFYCSRGGQSMLACNYMSKLGYQVVNIAGGISVYQGKYMVWQ